MHEKNLRLGTEIIDLLLQNQNTFISLSRYELTYVHTYSTW